MLILELTSNNSNKQLRQNRSIELLNLDWNTTKISSLSSLPIKLHALAFIL